MRSRLGRALGIAAICAVVGLPAQAHAAEVETNHPYLTYDAAEGEANSLTVTIRDREVDFVDTGAQVDNLRGGAGCTGRGTGTLTCQLPPGMKVKVKLDDGDDTVEVTAGSAKLDGEDGNDTIIGGPGADSLSGGAGDDLLQGRGGTDTYAAGDGFDRIDYSDHTAGVFASFDGVANDGSTGEDELVPADAEHLVGGQGDDVLTAAPTGSRLQGLAGADTLRGNAGTDSFLADDGSDRVYAADGNAEQVSCGADLDYFSADPLDALFECEVTVVPEDDPGAGPNGGSAGGGTAPAPELGRTVTVEPARGTVTIRPPGGKTVELREGDDIPLGSVVDATRGTVELTSAADASGATQTANFRDGVFKVKQTRGAAPVTELVLAGRLSCPSGRERTVSSAGRRRWSRRRLWGSGKGRFRTRGRRSSATVRGTIWMTEDRCSGTVTRVKRGVVAVKDFGTGKTTLVRAGKQHFAAKR